MLEKNTGVGSRTRVVCHGGKRPSKHTLGLVRDPSFLTNFPQFFKLKHTNSFLPLLRNQIGNLKKNPPIGREGVYDENSDFRGKKTNRMEKNIKYID
jgi:hypothetical protein